MFDSRLIFVNSPDQPNIPQVTSINDWLKSVQLTRLMPFFLKAGYRNLSQICHLNSPTLVELTGNALTREEKTRLLDSLRRLRSQLVFLNSSKPTLLDEGFLV